MSVARKFGENVRRIRKRAGLSLEEVGVRATLHRTEVGMVERGERLPRIDTAIKLASALEVDIEELIQGIAWRPGFTHVGQFRESGGEEGEDNSKKSLIQRPRQMRHQPRVNSQQTQRSQDEHQLPGALGEVSAVAVAPSSLSNRPPSGPSLDPPTHLSEQRQRCRTCRLATWW
jgi:transcriptional regulator with XRE-family HTH domain